MLLPKNHLIRPANYLERAFDTNPDDHENKFDRYTVLFKCGSCRTETESERLMIKGNRIKDTIPLKGINRAEFFERCDQLRTERRLGTPFFMEHRCSNCDQNHLILFGAAEWQPGRDVIELGGIYLY